MAAVGSGACAAPASPNARRARRARPTGTMHETSHAPWQCRGHPLSRERTDRRCHMRRVSPKRSPRTQDGAPSTRIVTKVKKDETIRFR